MRPLTLPSRPWRTLWQPLQRLVAVRRREPRPTTPLRRRVRAGTLALGSLALLGFSTGTAMLLGSLNTMTMAQGSALLGVHEADCERSVEGPLNRAEPEGARLFQGLPVDGQSFDGPTARRYVTDRSLGLAACRLHHADGQVANLLSAGNLLIATSNGYLAGESDEQKRQRTQLTDRLREQVEQRFEQDTEATTAMATTVHALCQGWMAWGPACGAARLMAIGPLRDATWAARWHAWTHPEQGADAYAFLPLHTATLVDAKLWQIDHPDVMAPFWRAQAGGASVGAFPDPTPYAVLQAERQARWDALRQAQQGVLNGVRP